MHGKMRILGKMIPAWAVAGALILGTAGAATGVVMAGRVTGTLTATVNQSLTVANGTITGADASLVTVSDDGTKFTASSEINTGDKYRLKLALVNAGHEDLVGELVLVAPDGITLSVKSAGDIVDDIVRTGPFTWKFRILSDDADGTPGPNGTVDMVITVALADDMPPGFYAIDGTLKQVAV